MKKLLYLIPLLFSLAGNAQIIRCTTCSGGGSIDTTPLHNQIVANTTALAGKLSSQVGTITDPQDTIYTFGDSFGSLQQGWDGNPADGWFHYWYDWPHLIANSLNKKLRNYSYGGEHIVIWDSTNHNDNDPISRNKWQPVSSTTTFPYKNSKSSKIVVCLGVNDVLHLDQSDTAKYRRDYTRFLDSLVAHGFSGTDFVLCTVPYETAANNKGTLYDPVIHQYINNTVIPQLVTKYGAIMADPYNFELQHGREANVWSDSVHVTFTLGQRNIATAILNAWGPHQVINSGQALAINNTVEFRDMILHTHKVVTANTRNYTHLGVDSVGNVILITETAEPTLLDTMQTTPGSWIMRGKLGAGGYDEYYDVGNFLLKGGGQADWLGITTANTTNRTGVGFAAGSNNPYSYPGLYMSMSDSNTAYFNAKNPRTGSAINWDWAASHVLFNTITVPTDGSTVAFNSSLAVNTLNVSTGTAGQGYAGQLNYSGSMFNVDAYNGSAATSLSLNQHGASTCVACGFGTAADASAIWEWRSTTKGVLPPRMTTTQRTAIATPAEGLMVYDTTAHKLYVWDGSLWQAAW